MYFSLESKSDFPINDVGYEIVYKVKFSKEDVLNFAKITGDNNPIHTDIKYASKTIFKKPIVHGFFVGSIFSRIFGTEYPGIGTIYLNQTMKFLAPVFFDELYYARVMLVEVDKNRGRAKILTEVFDVMNKSVLLGEAELKHESYMNINSNLTKVKG